MPKDQPPLVSIVTLNWNATDVTCDFLRSVKEKVSYPHIEMIVVDNASAVDPTADFLSVYPSAKVIRNSANLGFAAGNNAGIRQAKGDFLFIVNNDTEFTEGLIEGLLDIFEKYPDAGMASPKFHYYFNKGTIEYAGYEQVNILTGRNGMIGCREKDNGQYNTVHSTHYGHGGAMMVPRKVIEDVGLMEEKFFLYYEELDWSNQIKKKNYKIYYQPASLIYHKESMTTGKSSPLKTYYLTRNRILFMKRNSTGLSLAAFLLYFTVFTVPKNTFTLLLKGQKAHLRSFWKGILWHFNHKITFN